MQYNLNTYLSQSISMTKVHHIKTKKHAHNFASLNQDINYETIIHNTKILVNLKHKMFGTNTKITDRAFQL